MLVFGLLPSPAGPEAKVHLAVITASPRRTFAPSQLLLLKEPAQLFGLHTVVQKQKA